MGRWCRTALLILLFSLPKIAVCEEKPLWELGAGLALLQMPDYSGSDKDRLYLLPYPYFIYRGDILNIDRDRISGRVFKTDKILFDFSFFGQAPVDSSDNETRRGMPDLDPTFEVGPSLTITLLDNRQDRYKLNLFLPVRAVFSTDFSSVHRRGLGIQSQIGFRKKRHLSRNRFGSGNFPGADLCRQRLSSLLLFRRARLCHLLASFLFRRRRIQRDRVDSGLE